MSDPSDVVPLTPAPTIAVTRDETKIAIVRRVLERLERGEQFTSIAVLLADNHQYEAPFDGMYFELIVATERLKHKIHRLMDAQQDED